MPDHTNASAEQVGAWDQQNRKVRALLRSLIR